MATKNPRMSADERRSVIIEAALHEFAKGGLEGTTTDAIARRAGVSQPYVVRLFGTKKALFIAVIERQYQRLCEAFVEAADGLQGAQALQAMGEVYPRSMLNQRHLVILQLHTYAACDDPEIRAVVGRQMRDLYARIDALTGAGPDALRLFFAVGMLMSVSTAIDVPELLGGPDWSERSGWECLRLMEGRDPSGGAL